MRRATLNHTYKLNWGHVKRIFVAVAEIANGQSKKGGAAMLL